ncbi:MAG: lambda exonuclease family protein [Pseudomonadota bacterium]
MRVVSATYHDSLQQGSDEWLQMRCGLLTASEMKLIVTPTGKVANNDKVRAHAYELAFQRLTNYVEPQYISDAMLRGQEDEIYARQAYHEHHAPVRETGFITNNRWGFTIGYSPDGLVGDDGLIECKSRCGKYHVQTIAQDYPPEEYHLQLQTALLVSERDWIDFISYCGGLPVYVKRVEPDPDLQASIIEAATAFEQRVQDVMSDYRATIANMTKLIPTERRVYEEIVI